MMTLLNYIFITLRGSMWIILLYYRSSSVPDGLHYATDTSFFSL